jgi:hypothetical protein
MLCEGSRRFFERKAVDEFEQLVKATGARAAESEIMLTTLAISNYRSLRDFVMPLGPLNLITGPNGSGKSSVYRGPRASHDRMIVALYRASLVTY